ncbi:DedA family protein [Actinotalea sp. JY-7885]|uniref:DedA family protein n=1 Tax=Actinotalea sp. JY-7885 TaxID=2758576 RepID=UPI00165DB076|nr:VTT domain-containing protein [Actinotalea sp. JY-7885]
MPEWLEGWPFLPVYLFFVGGAAVRSQATYWVGRGITAGVLRSRWAHRLENPQIERATRLIERWGMPVVPLSFLTVGLQSAVHLSAGVLRLAWPRYTLWAFPGYLAWALVWAGGGMAAVAGAVELGTRSPWALAAVVCLLAGVVAAFIARRRRRAAAGAETVTVVQDA